MVNAVRSPLSVGVPSKLSPAGPQPRFANHEKQSPITTETLKGYVGKLVYAKGEEYDESDDLYRATVVLDPKVAVAYRLSNPVNFDIQRATFEALRENDPVDLVLIQKPGWFGGTRQKLLLDEQAILRNIDERRKGWLADDLKKLDERLRETRQTLAEQIARLGKRLQDKVSHTWAGVSEQIEQLQQTNQERLARLKESILEQVDALSNRTAGENAQLKTQIETHLDELRQMQEETLGGIAEQFDALKEQAASVGVPVAPAQGKPQ